MGRLIYTVWKPGPGSCVARMPWNWHRNRGPKSRRPR